MKIRKFDSGFPDRSVQQRGISGRQTGWLLPWGGLLKCAAPTGGSSCSEMATHALGPLPNQFHSLYRPDAK